MVRFKYKTLKTYLPRVRFLTVHYAYFIGVSFITSAIFWGTSSPAQSVRYIDSLFLTVSAMTLAGLNTVNLSTLNTFQQVLLFFLIMFGSAIWVSIAVVLVRKQAFEKRFGEIVREERLRKRTRSSIGLGRLMTRPRSLSRQSTVTQEPARLSEPPLQLRSPLWRTPVVPSIPLHPARSQAQNQEPDSRTGPPDARQSDQQAEQIPSGARGDAESVAPDEALPNGYPLGEPKSNTDADSHIAFTSNVWNGSEERSSSPLRRRMLSPYVNVQNLSTTIGHLEQGPSDGGSDRERFNEAHLHFLRRFHRNSTLYNLSEMERQKLGGAEYRAICLLSIIVPTYFILWQLLGGLGVAAYLARNKASLTESNGLNPWFVLISVDRLLFCDFCIQQLWDEYSRCKHGWCFRIFCNNSLRLTVGQGSISIVEVYAYYHGLVNIGWQYLVRHHHFLLSGSMFGVLMRSCSYPIFLRWILYTIRLILPDIEYYHRFRDTLTFLLDHPRRSYTALFPSAHTWWLLLSVVVLNGIDWIAFEVLNIDNPAVDAIPRGSRVLDGLFQALCVRSGGFYIVNISTLQLGTLVIYVVMMYISVYPVAITMRHSNLYEERSLGVYADDTSVNEDDVESSSGASGNRPPVTPGLGRIYFIRHQLRAQMAYDLWWIALAVIIICIVEAGQFTRDPITYSAFNIIFETVSAYGCVGISIGLPNKLYSFSGGWHTLSKLVLCAVMIRGRHRGLPVAIDKAIMLPSDKLVKAEEEDAQIRIERTMSRRAR
ncbi:Low-affinity potassium transport protein [Penicillium riverlandense]|uniref:Low-affinity potassium transport protein n=1 Tax=Penicillium riverlandense TaxID=1903569 RepID=UPI002547205A|nr:Low-affinity potassium transport protein [Penicillium riverlandense]KAJ5832753.1 Low-affinity potassium transport protein [Penicillium riverlandense]